MKKISVTILAVLYLGVSSGVAMNIHYCMGKFSSVDFYKYSGKCGKCGMKKVSGCCQDEFKILKLDDTHKLISNNINISAPLAIINTFKSIFNSDAHYSVFQSHFNSNSPPGSPEPSLCILNCVFRV